MATTADVTTAGVVFNIALRDFLSRVTRGTALSAGNADAAVAVLTDARAALIALDTSSQPQTAPVVVSAVTIIPGTVAVTAAGGASHTFQLAALITDAGSVVHNRPVTWASSDATKATVSATGLVTGVAAGTPTVTATSEGVASSARTVTVS